MSHFEGLERNGTMLVRSKTHNELKDQYNDLQALHKDDLERIKILHANFEAIASRSDAVTAENASLSIFALDALAWIEDVPLYVRGTKTPELRKRREEMREQARKLGILVEDVPGEEEEEQSA